MNSTSHSKSSWKRLGVNFKREPIRIETMRSTRITAQLVMSVFVMAIPNSVPIRSGARTTLIPDCIPKFDAILPQKHGHPKGGRVFGRERNCYSVAAWGGINTLLMTYTMPLEPLYSAT